MTANKRIINGVVGYSLHEMIMAVMVLLLSALPRDVSAKYTTSCVKGIDLHVTPGNISITADDSSAYPVGTLIGGPYSGGDVVAFTFTGQQCSVGSGSSTGQKPVVSQSLRRIPHRKVIYPFMRWTA
jgi:hypothetical protein